MPLPWVCDPALTKGYRFAMMFSGVCDTAIHRCRYNEGLRDARRRITRPISYVETVPPSHLRRISLGQIRFLLIMLSYLRFDSQNPHYRAFCGGHGSFAGSLIIRGKSQLVGIIQTPFPTPDDASSWESVYPGELSAIL